MAKVKHNKFTMGLSGKFGNLVFRQMKDGRTIVAAAPDFSNRVPSPEQLNNQSRFKQAVAYAREAAKSQPIYTERTRKKSSTPYNLALSDWFHPPVIHEVLRGDGGIHVKASDNVQVTKVLVTISDSDGNTLEQGQATSQYGDFWEYVTSAPAEANVTVEVFDLPGNCTKQEA